MQEYHVTAAGRTYPLERPFFVLATQNPIELEGTYPLPEAQLDRFMFNIVMTYLSEDEEVRVVTTTTGVETHTPARVFTGADILQIQQLVRQVVVAEEVARYTVRLVDASRPGRQSDHQFMRDWVKWGAGPARLPVADPRRQGARAHQRPVSRVGGRHPGARASGAAPSDHPEFLRRVRAHHGRQPGRAAARGRSHTPQRHVAMAQSSTSRDLRFLDPAIIARLGHHGAEGAHGGGGLSVGTPPQPVQRASASSSPNTASTCRATICPPSTGKSSRDRTGTT